VSISLSFFAFVSEHLSQVRHIPDWVPGAGFKRKASAWASTLREMVDLPHNFVKQQMVSNHFNFYIFFSLVTFTVEFQEAGTASTSFTSKWLETKPTVEEEFNIKWTAASLYSGMCISTLRRHLFLAHTLLF